MSSEPIGEVARLQARRAAIVANLSPAARHAAFPRLYARPVPDPDEVQRLRKEVSALRGQCNSLVEQNTELQAVVAQLTAEAELLRHSPPPDWEGPEVAPPATMVPLTEAMDIYIKALATVGYLIDDAPVTFDHLRGPQRSLPWVRPRHVGIWLCRRLCLGVSFPMIAKAFGNRDHTTPLHAFKRAPRIMEQCPQLRAAAMIVISTFARET